MPPILDSLCPRGKRAQAEAAEVQREKVSKQDQMFDLDQKLTEMMQAMHEMQTLEALAYQMTALQQNPEEAWTAAVAALLAQDRAELCRIASINGNTAWRALKFSELLLKGAHRELNSRAAKLEIGRNALTKVL